jgi:hypothetical protein
MSAPSNPINSGTYEERAFFAQLAALNATVESAKAGDSAQQLFQNASLNETLLAAFLHELKTTPIKD